MNLFAFSGILLGTTCLILILIIALYGKTKLHRVWLLFNVAVAIWGFGSYFIGKASNPSSALTSWKFATVGAIFISVFFYHTTCIFCEIENARRKLIVFAYLQAIFFLLLDLTTNLLVIKVAVIFKTLFYLQSEGLFYPLFVSIWLILVILGHYELIAFYRKSSGIKKNQSLYFFMGIILGFSGGGSTFLPVFGVDIYPIGNFTIPIYCLISTYAILRYRLMDFHVVLKKSIAYSLSVALLTGLFLALVFTVTKYFSEMTGMTSLTVMAIYTLVIAVLFTPLKNKIQIMIDKVFYKTTYDYYTVVKKISYELATTIGLQPTHRVIVDTIFHTLKLRKVYLLSVRKGIFETVYFKSANPEREDGLENRQVDNQLSNYAKIIGIIKNGAIIIKDELILTHDQNIAQAVAEELRPFDGEAVAPIFIEGRPTYLLLLGSKLSTDAFTNEDVNLLTTIVNQASIALKNAKLYDELEQRVQARTADLSKAIEKLHKEIAERKRIEEALQNAQRELELRVQERTAELKDANMKLMQEVIERMKVEEAVRTAAEQWRATFDSMKDVIIMIDKDDRIIRVNRASASLFNTEYSEIVKKPIAELFQSIGVHEEVGPLARSKQSRQHEEDELFIPGKDAWVIVSTAPVFNDDALVGTVCILSDVTERKKAEEEKKKLQDQLIQTQKMESIGCLAGGIAHDFNNVLSAIICYSEVCLMKLPEGSDLKDIMQIIRSSGEKAAGLTHQLLAFSRKQILEMKDVDLVAAVVSMGKMLSRLIGEHITIEIINSSSVKSIRADEVQVEQIIMNLAVNARDSMPNGGTLVIETSDVRLDETADMGPEKVVPGPYVMLAVKDTGQGMTREIKERIFEPFFTTKEKGKGTGMGLATVYGIVMQHKGRITVDSAPGKGTTFRVYFPVARGKAGETGVGKKYHTTTLTGNETILVVDDEPVMCTLVADTLQPFGYNILQTSDVNEALGIADAFDGNIDLLVTDVIMHGMNGKQLADAFLQKRPDAKVLYMSGYPNDIIGGHGVLEAGAYFIQKPLNAKALASKVRDALGGREEPGDTSPSPDQVAQRLSPGYPGGVPER